MLEVLGDHVAQLLDGLRPVVGVFGRRTRDDLLQLRGNPRPLEARRLTLHRGHQDRGHASARMPRPPGQHLEQRRPEQEHIGAFVDLGLRDR